MGQRAREAVGGWLLAIGIVITSAAALAVEGWQFIEGTEAARQARDEPSLENVSQWLPTGDAAKVGAFWMAYDGRTRSARYVVEGLPRSGLEASHVPRYSHFYVDVSAPPEARSTDDDYAGSGYDRGHLAPSANHLRTVAENAATFSLSNVAPQDASMNRGIWRRIETHVRELTTSSPAIVVTCPLYLPTGNRLTIDVIGPSRVWVPTHFGKAILYRLRSGEYATQAWLVPNVAVGHQSMNSFLVSIDRFESAAGFDLWAALPDLLEMTLESTDPLRPVPEESLPR